MVQGAHDGGEPANLVWKPEGGNYLAGERISADVFGIDGSALGTAQFTILSSPGSGFAGQVYQAVAGPGSVFDGLRVALKVLRPRSRLKTWFRDLLFKLSFGTSFAPRLRVAALRSGLIWQEILRTAVGIELGRPAAISRGLGYYWEAALHSFVEVHEWVDSRPVRYAPDDGIFTRPCRPNVLKRVEAAPDSEMRRKQRFMADLVRVCHQVGAPGLARQFEWYTLVSQANVLFTNPGGPAGEFVAVDCRPGLAVPFFLPLSPAHARILWAGLRRGVLAHYDEVDLDRLEAYLNAHPEQCRQLAGLVGRLKEDDRVYRSSLPDFWHTRARLFIDRAFRQRVRAGLIGDWLLSEKISPRQAERLQRSAALFACAWLLDNLPLIGQPMLRLWGNEHFRTHLVRLLRDPGYRHFALDTLRSRDLPAWQQDGRIAPGRAAWLRIAPHRYLPEKLALSWLPGPLHRFLTDRQARRSFWSRLLVQPFWLLTRPAYRETWLQEIARQQIERGVLSEEQAQALRLQLREPRLQGFLRDLGFTFGLELFSKLVYLALAGYGALSGQVWLLAVALFGPLPPSGVARFVYVLTQLIADRFRKETRNDRRLLPGRLLGLALAPWRFVGNLFAPVEMYAYYTDLSLLLADYYVSRLVQVVPVLGGRGKLLEYWLFHLVYNVPLSLRRLWGG